jgi:hypothetical protein
MTFAVRPGTVSAPGGKEPPVTGTACARIFIIKSLRLFEDPPAMYKRLWVLQQHRCSHFQLLMALLNRRLDFAGQEVLSLSRYKNRLKKYPHQHQVLSPLVQLQPLHQQPLQLRNTRGCWGCWCPVWSWCPAHFLTQATQGVRSEATA